MGIRGMIRNGLTQTSFGRNREKLSRLEEALAESGFDEHRGLVVGAGLYLLPFARLMNYAHLKRNPYLRRPYSWEAIELAAILERQGKPWAITVVDSSTEVCAALAQQENTVIHDYGSAADPELTGYAERLLASLGITGNNDAEMEAINKRLESRGIENRLSVLKKAEIPLHIRSRIQAVQGSVVNLGNRLAGTYSVVTCFNAMMYIPSEFVHSAQQSLQRAAAQGAVVASDTDISGFRPGGPYTPPQKL